MSSDEEDIDSIEEDEEEVVVQKPKRKRKKKKKDPNRPKRNMSAFFLYSNANRARVKEENPEAKFGDIVSSSIIVALLLLCYWRAALPAVSIASLLCTSFGYLVMTTARLGQAARPPRGGGRRTTTGHRHHGRHCMEADRMPETLCRGRRGHCLRRLPGPAPPALLRPSP